MPSCSFTNYFPFPLKGLVILWAEQQNLAGVKTDVKAFLSIEAIPLILTISSKTEEKKVMKSKEMHRIDIHTLQISMDFTTLLYRFFFKL